MTRSCAYKARSLRVPSPLESQISDLLSLKLLRTDLLNNSSCENVKLDPFCQNYTYLINFEKLFCIEYVDKGTLKLTMVKGDCRACRGFDPS